MAMLRPVTAAPDQPTALPEQVAAGFGPDVLTLQDERPDDDGGVPGGRAATVIQGFLASRTACVERAPSRDEVSRT